MLEPRKWHHFIYLSLMGLGLAVVNKFPSPWETLIGVYFSTYGLVLGVGHEFKEYEDYRRWQRIDEIPKPVPAVADLLPDFTPRLGSVPNFNNQAVAFVKFDMERQYAKTLLIMRGYKPNCEAVDLRETYWVKPNKFRTRPEYLVVRDKWEAHHIIRKAAARMNAPYVVTDWYKVEQVASGTKLPPLPQVQ